MVDSAALLDGNALAEPRAAGRRDGHGDSNIIALRRLLRGFLRFSLAGGVGGLRLDGTEIVDIERLARRLELRQSDQGTECLFSGRVVIRHVARISESGAIRHREGHQALHYGQTVLGKARIASRIHSHRRQPDNDHRGRVRVVAIAAIVHRTGLELRGQIVHALVDSRLHLAVVGVESQACQHIRCGIDGAPLVPTAIRLLCIQQSLDQFLLIAVRARIVSLIIGRQRIRRAPRAAALADLIQQRNGVDRGIAVDRIQLGNVHTVGAQRQNGLVKRGIRDPFRLDGRDRYIDVILLRLIRQPDPLSGVCLGIGAHIHGPPIGGTFSIGRRNGVHHLLRIEEHLLQRIVDLLITGQHHFVQSSLFGGLLEVVGVTHRGKRRASRLCAVAVDILYGDTISQARHRAAQLPGKAAVIALRRRTDDGHLSRAYGVFRLADSARKAAGIIRTADSAGAVAVLHLAVAVSREAARAAFAGNGAGSVAIIDVSAAVTHQAAGHGAALHLAACAGFGDGTAVFSYQTAGPVHTRDGHIRGALVDGTGDGEQGIRVGLALIQANETSDAGLARHLSGHRAVAHQIGYIPGQIVLVQFRPGIAHQAAHVDLAGNIDIFQVQIFDGRTLDDIEESYILPALLVNGHVGDSFSFAIERPCKRVRRAADTLKADATQIQFLIQPIVLGQDLVILRRRQRYELLHRGNSHPLDAIGLTAFDLTPRGSLEAVLGGALEPQYLGTILHLGQGCADIGHHVVDGKHPTVRCVHRVIIDGVDEPAEGAGSGIAVGQQALPLRFIHHVHQAGIAAAVHGDGDDALLACRQIKAVRHLVIRHHSQLYRDRCSLCRLRGLDAHQIGQAAVLIGILRPHADLAVGDSRQERFGLHLIQRSAASADTVLICAVGVVVVAIVDTDGLVVLEAAPRQRATHKATAIITAIRNFDRTCRIAVQIFGVLLHGPGAAHKAACAIPRRHAAQGKAVFDDAAVAIAYEPARNIALSADIHAGPAALDQGALLI